MVQTLTTCLPVNIKHSIVSVGIAAGSRILGILGILLTIPFCHHGEKDFY